jgi:uncharacterized membrane protein required for colicin V production
VIGLFRIETVEYILIAVLVLIGLAAVIATVRRSPIARALGCLSFVSGLMVLACGYSYVMGWTVGVVQQRLATLQAQDTVDNIGELSNEIEDISVPSAGLGALLIGAVTWPIGWRRSCRAAAGNVR